MSQIDEDAIAQKDARDAAKALKELRDHPGWHIIKSFIEDQISTRINQYVLQPRRDMASEWEAEYMKGEVAGMKMVVATVESELETQEAIKDALNDREASRSENARDSDDARGE